MAGEKKGLDMKVLATQDKLTDADFQNIQAEVLAEEGIKPPEEKPVVEEGQEHKEEGEHEGETADEKAAREKAETEAAERQAAEEAETIAAENKRLLEAKVEDLNEEEKTKREELIKAGEEAKKQKEEEDKKLQEQFDTDVKAYAVEHKVSEEEARADFESREKILEKYKSDPKQLALANLHLQRMYTKSQEALKAVEEAKPLQHAKTASLEDYVKLLEDGKIVWKDKPITKEQAISIYREQFPDIAEGLEDEAVVKLVAEKIKEGYLKSQENAIAERSSLAKEKRKTVLNSLSDNDKKYIPEIQPLLEKFPDAAILSDHFDVQDLVYHIKGKNYDRDLKELGDKEYKRGLAQAKIIGQRPGPTAQGSQKPKVKSKVTLTEAQKKDALDKYDGTTFTDEEKYEAYAELLALDQKDNKK